MVSFLMIVVTTLHGLTQYPGANSSDYAEIVQTWDTFSVQANILKQMFIDKGYDPETIELDLRTTLETNRSFLLEIKPKRKQDDSFKWALLTSFSTQYKQVKSIITKHWEIVREPTVEELSDVLFTDQQAQCACARKCAQRACARKRATTLQILYSSLRMRVRQYARNAGGTPGVSALFKDLLQQLPTAA